MKKFIPALSLAALLAAGTAYATVPLVNPVTVGFGPPVHLTPRDQDGAEIPGMPCTIANVPGTIATVTYDATGAVLTAVGTGSVQVAQWKCVNGATTVTSAPFTVTVPWSVTAVGDTMP